MQTKPVEVSQQLQDGEKFIKWDEVCIFNGYWSIVLMSDAGKSINVKGHALDIEKLPLDKIRMYY